MYSSWKRLRCSFSVRIRGHSCSVGPPGHRNIELGYWLGGVLMYVYRRAREICTPIYMALLGKPKHQMGIGVPGLAAKVLLFRHHVAHRPRFRQRQFLFVVCGLDTVEHLGFRLSSHCQFSRFERERQVGPRGWRIKTKRDPLIRVQKLWIVKRGHPRSLHNAHPAVLAFDRSFVAMPPEDQDLGIAGDGLRSRTPRQGYLAIPVGHEI